MDFSLNLIYNLDMINKRSVKFILAFLLVLVVSFGLLYLTG